MEGKYEKEGYGQRLYTNWEKIMFDCEGEVRGPSATVKLIALQDLQVYTCRSRAWHACVLISLLPIALSSTQAGEG